MKMRIGHISMESKDDPKQQQHDADAIMARARKRELAWITGTEAGANAALRRALQHAARQQNYLLHCPTHQDGWVIVDRELMVNGAFIDSGYIPVVSTEEGVGHHTAKGIAWVTFKGVENLGNISVGASHFLTKGRRPSDPNWGINERFAHRIGDWMDQKSRGNNLAFIQADTNRIDKTDDVFSGEDILTSGDILGKHEGTGHGNIDVIGKGAGDKRVHFTDTRVLKDREFFLYTDHFFLEVGMEIDPIRRRG